MPAFRDILVGVDLSSADRLAGAELTPPVRAAVERGIELAREMGARLTFFASLDLSAHTLEFLERSGATGTVREQAEKALAALVGKAEREGVEASSEFVFGRSWVEIIRQVLREGHDVVIVGTRELGAAGRILLGSTGMKLVRKCPCPVWIARPDPTPDEWNVLVATDLGDIGRRAVELVVQYSHSVDMKVHVLHAIEQEFDRWTQMTGLSDAEIAQLRRAKREEIERELHDQLGQTDYRTVPSGVLMHVEEGLAESVIREAIARFDIDLLVMGTVGRRGLPGLFVGNTAERLLADVPCSVLVLKPRDFSSPITLE
ncbi:MAG: universal stress protein [Planctomycetaceae bacterium]